MADALTKACIVAAVIMSVVVAIQFITAGSMDYLLRSIAILACLVVMVNMSIKWQNYTDNVSNKKEQDGLLESFNSCMQNAECAMRAQELSEQQRQEELSNICGALYAIPERIAHLMVEYGISAERREAVLSSTCSNSGQENKPLSHVENGTAEGREIANGISA
ncbi:hypothetical protein APHNP_1702 [Anaplasma phagocytophilum str. ApNP]|uniref:Uncharacterized protein n=1 Tax=Anaplasma phagocytophilum str. ApNP TaxID=1359153 RepID=A0A0F3NM33_ANAPH|nr:hypothetical protein APHNP_1702 [Anaplasma phagocytophilum str. ApNP]